MNTVLAPLNISPVLQFDVQIDWDHMLKSRPALLKHSELPPYLIKPEVTELLRFAKHANNHLMFSTLWRTGARVSELLALTRESFHIDGIHSYVTIETLKKRGRKKSGEKIKPPRMVSITEPGYLMELESYLVTNKIKKGEKLFTINRQAVYKRVKRLVELAEKGGIKMSVPVSPHTFRHSYAVNCVLHMVDISIIKKLLGHSSIEQTQIYTEVLGADIGHIMQRVKF